MSPLGFSEGEPELESLKDSRTTPASLSESKPATIARAKAEANPLASKLGLTTGVSRPTTSVINAVAPRGAPQLRGPGHGPGRGRFGKAVVPGRGGRPLYYPLTKASVRCVSILCKLHICSLSQNKPGQTVDLTPPPFSFLTGQFPRSPTTRTPPAQHFPSRRHIRRQR